MIPHINIKNSLKFRSHDLRKEERNVIFAVLTRKKNSFI